MGLGLGSWLCHHSPLKPRSHHCRPAKDLDHRYLPSVVKYCLPGRIKSGASQLGRAGGMPSPHQEEGSGEARGEPAEGSAQQLRKVTQRKLVDYKRQDAAKGLRFNLKVDHILRLKEAKSNRCAACNIELLWAYQPKDTQQFSVDRLDKTMGYIRDNTRLTCLN